MPDTKDENPFNLLLEDMTNAQTTTKQNLNFSSLLKSNNKRGSDRLNTTGFVIVYNADGVGLSKAVLRNISPGGLGIETLPVEIAVNAKVFIEMCGRGETLGRIQCTVTRVSNIDGHPKNHKNVGLKFEETSAEFKKKFEVFYKSLKTPSRN